MRPLTNRYVHQESGRSMKFIYCAIISVSFLGAGELYASDDISKVCNQLDENSTHKAGKADHLIRLKEAISYDNQIIRYTIGDTLNLSCEDKIDLSVIASNLQSGKSVSDKEIKRQLKNNKKRLVKTIARSLHAIPRFSNYEDVYSSMAQRIPAQVIDEIGKELLDSYVENPYESQNIPISYWKVFVNNSKQNIVTIEKLNQIELIRPKNHSSIGYLTVEDAIVIESIIHNNNLKRRSDYSYLYDLLSRDIEKLDEESLYHSVEETKSIISLMIKLLKTDKKIDLTEIPEIHHKWL